MDCVTSGFIIYFLLGRILQNWDFFMHRVSKESALVIDEIVSIPMLHMSALAPELYLYVGTLDRVRKLRHQLSGLCRYLNACKKVSEAEGWRRAISKFKNKEYLLEHIDIYSVQDLMRVHMNLMIPDFKECVNEGLTHVKACPFCQAQAYICEVRLPPGYLIPSCRGPFRGYVTFQGGRKV